MHSEPNGAQRFVTSCVVVDFVVGLPYDTKKVLVSNVQRHEVTVLRYHSPG